ncbi:MAG: AbrB family transcriptional regulator [Alphaproteobacteria bacterium]|nr:AbrB family transcriptional regulator [Alphaproteobacteria bacterium]
MPSANASRLHDVGRLVLALTIGAAGGWVFAQLRLPLPWMLGAMTAVTIAALAGAPVRMMRWLRSIFITVLGVMLGASFTPTVVARMPGWWPTLLALGVWAALTTWLGWLYFRRRAGFDPITAYFAAAPGGLNEMITVGGQLGGDERMISLAHATRVLITVFAIPIWFRLHGDIAVDGGARATIGLLDVGLQDYAILAACAAVGALGGARLGIPAAFVLGPMFLSAGIHLAGITESTPPTLIVQMAQVIIGSTVGCRFVGVPVRRVGQAIGHAAIVAVIMIAIAVAFAFTIGRLSGLPIAAIVLAFAPGGLAEMSLVALALAVDAAFVATHHMARILMIILLAPTIFSWLKRKA